MMKEYSAMNQRRFVAAPCAFLLLAAAVTAHAQVGFPDVPKNHWAADSVARVKSAGIVKGYPAVAADRLAKPTYSGDKPVTRYELAVVLWRFVQYMERADHQTKSKQGASSEPRFGSEAGQLLVKGGYLPPNSPLLKNGETVVNARQLADTLSAVIVKIKERQTPMAPESEKAPVERPTSPTDIRFPTPRAVMIDLQQFTTERESCMYLPDREACLTYEVVTQLSPAEYEARMNEGWRKFGPLLFHPTCETCQECRPIRIPVARFAPDRSQRRALRQNADLTVSYAPPTVDDQRLALYRRYHAAQTERKNWPEQEKSADEYAFSFLQNPVPSVEIAIYESDILRAHDRPL